MGNLLSAFENPPVNAQNDGLPWWEQNIYNHSIPVDLADARNINNSWRRIGYLRPTFGAATHTLPLYSRAIIPGSLYEYYALIYGRKYLIKQTNRLLSGSVVDILGVASPMIRWRTVIPNVYWDGYLF